MARWLDGLKLQTRQFDLNSQQASGTRYSIVSDRYLEYKILDIRGSKRIPPGIFKRKSSNYGLPGHCRIPG
jgi:hypothetical protein